SGDASISLKVITSNTQTMTVQLTNNGKDKATYSFNNYGGVWTNSATSQQNAYDDKLSGAAINLASATNHKGESVLDGNQKITVAANDTVTVKVKLTLPQQVTNSYVEGYVGFQAENNGVTTSAQNLV
ncbi:Fn3-like domain-containing protein, partial [Leuconostoc suionicum]|uniref:Fn3-like domain-containing protein n=1 Tax=Leuconostoc suionicum TaxID=1511761 RepID=UPI00300C2650